MFCDFKRVSPKVRTIISCQTFLGKKAERERERERERDREREREREREILKCVWIYGKKSWKTHEQTCVKY